MRTFPKIILGSTIPIVIGLIFTSYFAIYQQSKIARDSLITQYRDLADFLAQEVEVGYYESNWPFENLASLAQKSDFVFWWLVDDRGRIYLANDSSFMGADAIGYFPQISRQSSQEGFTQIDGTDNGIYFKNFEAGKKQWSFWIGFSLESLDASVRRIIILNLLVGLASFLLIALTLSVIIRRAVRPLDDLVRGTHRVATGQLDYRITTSGEGEFEYLAKAFNSMTEKLQGHYRELEEKVRERTVELEQASSQLATEKKNALAKAEELERMNATMIGRELKMVELKQENTELKKRLESR